MTAGIAYAIQTNVEAHRGQDWGAALSAAQAGIEDYVARLNRNDNYGRTWDCTNTALKGPNADRQHLRLDRDAPPTGWIPVVATQPKGPAFHYDVDAPASTRHGTITVISTGRVGQGQTRTIEAAIGRGGSTDFLYYTDLEDADPTNTTAYPTGTTASTSCGGKPARRRTSTGTARRSAGRTARTRAASRSASPPVTCWTVACTSTTRRR